MSGLGRPSTSTTGLLIVDGRLVPSKTPVSNPRPVTKPKYIEKSSPWEGSSSATNSSPGNNSSLAHQNPAFTGAQGNAENSIRTQKSFNSTKTISGTVKGSKITTNNTYHIHYHSK